MQEIDSNVVKRLPMSDIPEDFVCPMPECEGAGPRKNNRSYRAHMSAKHKIFYELNPKTVERIEKLRGNPIQHKDIFILKPWHRLMLLQHTLYGEGYTSLSKKFGKSKATISKIARSTAGQAYIQELENISADPMKMIEAVHSNSKADMYVKWMIMSNAAFENGDYKAYNMMMKDLGLKDMMEGPSTGPQHLTIMVGGGQDLLAKPNIQESFTVVDAEVVEIID